MGPQWGGQVICRVLSTRAPVLGRYFFVSVIQAYLEIRYAKFGGGVFGGTFRRKRDGGFTGC